jgi:hypothetical protein
MNATIQTFRSRLQQGNDAALQAEIEAAVLARREERSGHGDWALLCEQAGLVNLAFREFQLALRDNPDDDASAFRLAQHYREHGDADRAAGLLERLLQKAPAREDWLTVYAELLSDDDALPRLRAALQRAVEHGFPAERADALGRRQEADAEAESVEDALAPSDADCARFQALFAGREDVHARQWAQAGGEGGYSPVHEPLTPAVVRNHLLGTYTVGAYPIRLDGTCTYFALDLDIDRWALEKARGQTAFARFLRDTLRAEAKRLLAVLRELGFQPLFEDSGYKGRHYWVLLEQPEPAEVLHVLGRQFLAWQTPQLPHGLHLEFFPKQATLKGKGLGNLIKLPLGIHRRSGRRSAFLDDNGQALPQPLAALRQATRAARALVHAAVERLKGYGQAVPQALSADESGSSPRPTESLPAPPAPAPSWTEADFETDPRIRHVFAHCPVLTELKRQVDQHRQLSHEEQLVLIHSLGHVESGPQAVNYLLTKCVDVGPEKFMKDRLKGNPVSCPSIRKKIGHVTRRVACNCPFDFAPDRYPTPVLHLLTLPATAAPLPAAPAIDVQSLAERYGVLVRRRAEIEAEYAELQKSLAAAIRALPERTLVCAGGQYRLIELEGVEELKWEKQ